MPVFRRVFSDAAAQLSRRIAFGVRLDCVRRPIGLRSVSDQIAFAARRLGVSFLTVGGECVKTYE